MKNCFDFVREADVMRGLINCYCVVEKTFYRIYLKADYTILLVNGREFPPFFSFLTFLGNFFRVK